LDWITHAVTEAFKGLMSAFTVEMGQAVMATLQDFLYMPTGLLNHPLMQALLGFTRTLSGWWFPVIIAWQGVRIVTRTREGAQEVDIMQLVRRWCLAAFVCYGNYALIVYTMRIGNSIIDSFVKGSTSLNMNLLVPLMVPGVSFAEILLTLVFIIGWIVLAVQRARLQFFFIIHMAIAPFAGISIAHQEAAEFWNTWLREMTSLLLTYVVQTILIWMFINLLGEGINFATLTLAIGCIWAMFDSPGRLREWTYNSGAGAAVLGGGATAGRMAVSYIMLRNLRAAAMPK
jgi:hypothetical protein